MSDKSIQEEIAKTLIIITVDYLRDMQSETDQYPEYIFVQRILKYLDSKGVRIEKENVWYNNVLVPVNERLVEE